MGNRVHWSRKNALRARPALPIIPFTPASSRLIDHVATPPLASLPIGSASASAPATPDDDSRRVNIIGVLISATSILYAASIIVVYGSLSAIFEKLGLNARGIFSIEDIALLSIDFFTYTLQASSPYWYIPLAVYFLYLVRPAVRSMQKPSLGWFGGEDPVDGMSVIEACQIAYVVLLVGALGLDWYFGWGLPKLLTATVIAAVLFSAYYARFVSETRKRFLVDEDEIGLETIAFQIVTRAKMLPALTVLFVVLLVGFVNTANAYTLRPFDIGLLISPRVCSGSETDYQALLWRGSSSSVVICAKTKSVVVVSQYENMVTDSMPLRRKDFDAMGLLAAIADREYDWVKASEKDGMDILSREEDAANWRAWQKLTMKEKEEALRTGFPKSRPQAPIAGPVSMRTAKDAGHPNASGGRLGEDFLKGIKAGPKEPSRAKGEPARN